MMPELPSTQISKCLLGAHRKSCENWVARQCAHYFCLGDRSVRSHQGIAWDSEKFRVFGLGGGLDLKGSSDIKRQRERECRWILRRMIALLDNWRKPVYLTRRGDERWWEVYNFGVVIFDLTACSCSYNFKILRNKPGFGPSLSSTLPSPIRSRQGLGSSEPIWRFTDLMLLGASSRSCRSCSKIFDIKIIKWNWIPGEDHSA